MDDDVAQREQLADEVQHLRLINKALEDRLVGLMEQQSSNFFNRFTSNILSSDRFSQVKSHLRRRSDPRACLVDRTSLKSESECLSLFREVVAAALTAAVDCFDENAESFRDFVRTAATKWLIIKSGTEVNASLVPGDESFQILVPLAGLSYSDDMVAVNLKELTTIEEQLSDVTEEKEKLTARYEETIKRQTAQLELLSSQVIEATSLKSQLQQLQESYDGLHNCNIELTRENKELNDRLDAHDSQFQTLYALRCSNNKLSDMLIAMENELRQTKEKLEQLEAKDTESSITVMEGLTIDNNTTSPASSSHDSDDEQYGRTISALDVLGVQTQFESQLSQLKAENEALQEANQELQDALKRSEVAYKRLEKVKDIQISDMKDIIREIQASVTSSPVTPKIKVSSSSSKQISSPSPIPHFPAAIMPPCLRSAVGSAAIEAVVISPTSHITPNQYIARIRILEQELKAKNGALQALERRLGLEPPKDGPKRLSGLVEQLLMENIALKDALKELVER